MRQLLNQVKQNPEQKMESIVKMINKLFNMPKWKEWDIQIEEKPEVLKSRRLALPEIVNSEGDDKKLFCNERLLKTLPVFNSEPLKKKHLILIHDEQLNRNIYENVIDCLTKCQNMISMKSRSIKRIQVPCGRGRIQQMKQEIENQIDQYKDKNGLQKNEEIFVIMIVNHENDYQGVKNILTDMNIMSQCI